MVQNLILSSEISGHLAIECHEKYEMCAPQLAIVTNILSVLTIALLAKIMITEVKLS